MRYMILPIMKLPGPRSSRGSKLNSQEIRLLKEQMADLARDKQALKEKYKSLQEKSKSSAKKLKGKTFILFYS